MRTKKIFLMACLLFLGFSQAQAQDSTVVDAEPAPRLRSLDAPRRNWAVGFRLGEPLGINVRKYFGTERNVAFDLNIGTFGGLWATERAHGGREYRNTGLSVNAQVLRVRNLNASGNFQAYYGFGGQVNRRREYPRNDLDVSFRRQISLGLNMTIGLEYRISERPISLFTEAGVYAELIQVPLWPHLLGGVGARFHF